jgi:hypothetical protein
MRFWIAEFLLTVFCVCNGCLAIESSEQLVTRLGWGLFSQSKTPMEAVRLPTSISSTFQNVWDQYTALTFNKASIQCHYIISTYEHRHGPRHYCSI